MKKVVKHTHMVTLDLRRYPDTLKDLRITWDYVTHRYVFRFFVGKKLAHEFIVNRTSKRCYKVAFVCTYNDELFCAEFLSFNHYTCLVDWLHYTHVFYKRCELGKIS